MSNADSVLSNSSMATLSNITVTTTTTTTTITENDLYNTTLFSSNDNSIWNSTSWESNYNYSSWYPNNNNNNNSSWDNNYNSSSWNPFCPTCIQLVTVQPPVVYYTYTYIYYVLLLLLIIAAVVCIKIGISRRNQLQRQAEAIRRRRALQLAEAPYGSTNNCNNPNDDNNTCHMGPKDFDFPPAYDDVMKSYLMAKQQTLENDAIEGAIGGFTTTATTSTAISTLTLETEIGSAINLSDSSITEPTSETVTTSTTTTTTTRAVINSSEPPSYEYSIEMSNTNDHIV